jgi:predicted ATP-grasp superfamily ATP-dependent carboligase
VNAGDKGELSADETVLLAAFEGWNDAGGAASDALNHLHEVWSAQTIGELDPEDYHDFQVNRPTIAVDEDGRRAITWPTTTIARTTAHGRTVYLAHGIEPSMRWRRYAHDLLDRAVANGVTTVITLGALLADVPHSRPIPVTVSSEDVVIRARLRLDPSTYEGPVGIVAVLAAEAKARGLTALSLWAAVPHYVAHPPSPKATLALLGRLEQLLGAPIPTGDLPDDARAWQDGVDELAQEDSDIAEYVQRLEEAKDTADLPEASGEAIAQEFERYLRRRDQGFGA